MSGAPGPAPGEGNDGGGPTEQDADEIAEEIGHQDELVEHLTPAPTPGRQTPHGGPWWRRRMRGKPDEPLSHLVRAMAYEVMVVLVTAAAVAVIAFVVLQGRFHDLYIKLRPHAPTSGQVALLTIGPEALYTWNPADPEPHSTPRGLLAELVTFLDAAGADVVVLDLLLDAPADGDEALAAAARAHGSVVAAERMQTSEPASGAQFAIGLSPTLVGAVHAGFANFQVEQSTLFSGDLLVRRVPLVMVANRSHLQGGWPLNQVGGRQDMDQVVPSLSLVAAFLHGGGSYDALHAQLQQGCDPTRRCSLTAEGLGLPKLAAPLHEPLTINFRGPEHADGIPVVTAARALRVMAQAALMRELGAPAEVQVPDDLALLLDGRVVVVGRVDAGANDRFVTPYGMPVPVGPDMSGPRIHAQIVDTLLSGRHIRSVGGPLAWLFGLGLAGLVLASARRVRDDLFGIAWLAIAAALFGLGALVFSATDGIALELGPPLLCLLAAVFYVTLRSWSIEESTRT